MIVYNCNLLIGAFFFLLLTMVFYFRQKRVHDLQDKIYSVMLVLCMTAVVCDFIGSTLNATAPQHPRALLYLLNILLLASVQACLPAVFLYILSTTDTLKEIRRPLRPLIYVPYGVMLVALLMSPLGGFGIFYLDAQNYYWSGTLHFLLYTNIAIYLLASSAVVTVCRRTLERKKRNVVISFTAIILLTGGVQILFPHYLITTAATALAITVMYYFLQSPAEKLDPLTGLFNRVQLPATLKSMEEQDKPYTLVLFQIRYMEEMRRAFGTATSNQVMMSFAALLKRRFPRCDVFYMDVARFAVLCSAMPAEEELLGWHNTSLRFWDSSMMVTVHTAAIPYREEREIADTLSLMEYLYKELTRKDDIFLLADWSTQQACNAAMWLSADIDKILQQQEAKVLFSPCRRQNGECAGEVAALHIETELYCFSGEQVAEAVVQKNLIRLYMQRLLEGAANRRAHYSAECTAFIPLPVTACMDRQSIDAMYSFAKEYGLDTSHITFSMREADVAGAIPEVLENIERLVQLGYGFCVDRFAADFTDITMLTRLPISVVRIDPHLMRLALRSDRQRLLLAGLIRVFHDLGKQVICAGSGGEAGAQLAFSLGADGWQATEEWQE